jgi:hypothetical protein
MSPLRGTSSTTCYNVSLVAGLTLRLLFVHLSVLWGDGEKVFRAVLVKKHSGYTGFYLSREEFPLLVVMGKYFNTSFCTIFLSQMGNRPCVAQ